MDNDAYELLKEISNESLKEASYGGLRTLLRYDSNFAEFSERNYRIDKFKTEHNYFLTSHERYIHLMGFIDALMYLNRHFYLDFNPSPFMPDEDYEEELTAEEEAYLNKLEEQQERERHAILSCISYLEFGET